MMVLFKLDDNGMLLGHRLWDGVKGDPIPKNTTDIEPPAPQESPFYEQYQIGFLKLTFDIEKKQWYEAATEEEAKAYYDELQKVVPPESDTQLLGKSMAQLRAENLILQSSVNDLGQQLVNERLQAIETDQLITQLGEEVTNLKIQQLLSTGGQ